jgi:hypothetical protein
LPNVLSFLLFAYSIWKLLEYQPKLQKWLGLLTLLFCLNVFEYFGLARGYGLSFAFLSFHIYAISRFQKSYSFRWFLLSMVSIVLAALSSFVLLPQLLISMVFVLLILLMQKRLKPIEGLVLLMSVGAFVWMLIITLKLNASGEMYLGARSELIEGLLFTLFKYLRFHFDGLMFQIGFSLFSLIIVCVLIINLFNIRLAIKSAFVFTALVLIGNILGYVVLANFFGINYPYQRAALYLVPLAFLSFFLIPSCSVNFKWFTWFYYGVAFFLASVLVIDFKDNFRLRSTQIEQASYLPAQLITTLSSIAEDAENENFTILISSAFTDVFRYYNCMKFQSRFSAIPEKINANATYYLSRSPMSNNFQLCTESEGTYLYKNKAFDLRVKQILKPNVKSQKSTSDEYIRIRSTSIAANNSQWLRLEFDIERSELGKCAVVINIKNEATEIYSNAHRLDDMLVKHKAHYVFYWPLPDDKELDLSLFVFNIDKKPISLKVQPIEILEEVSASQSEI